MNMSTFEEAHAAFIRYHLDNRIGERRGRLERGHLTAEKLFCQNIWWPLHGNFERLHPEFEVKDLRGRSYFCDFAWITPYVKLIIEIKGFGPHVQDMDRKRYCYELNRETYLSAMGYQVISFAFDDVSQNPNQCQSLLRLLMSRYQTTTTPTEKSNIIEREIIRLACTYVRPLRPIDVEQHLNISHRTAVKTLRSLCAKGWFRPITGTQGKYVVKYQMEKFALDQLI